MSILKLLVLIGKCKNLAELLKLEDTVTQLNNLEVQSCFDSMIIKLNDF